MRVLMISKACVTASYRSKLAYLNRYDGLDVGLVVPDHWGRLPFEPDPGDAEYPIFKQNVVWNGHNHFHWYPRLRDAITAFRPDLIHIDEEHYSVVTVKSMKLARRFNIPSLFFTWQNLDKKYPWPFSSFEQRVFRGCVAGIAGNQEAADIVRRKGFTKPIAIIPQFGTDLTFFGPRDRDATRSRYKIQHRFVVGYVGRLIEDKGIGDLLAAVEGLLRADPDMALLIVGNGPFGDKIREWVERTGLDAQTILLPWVPSDTMNDVMNLMDVVVLPSRTTSRWKEQFGRVLTEAMACRTVVIGSNSGEIPHVIGDAGMVFREGDIEALQEAIRYIRDNPKNREEYQQRGVDRVSTHFSQAAIAQKTAAFYRTLQGGTAE